MQHFVPDTPTHASTASRYTLPQMSTGVKLAASFTAILVAILAFVARGCVAEVVTASPFHYSSASNARATAQSAAASIQFDPEEETLTQTGAATLEQVAKTLKADPKATLHLGMAPVASQNQLNRAGLASLRAQTVTAFLTARGVDRSRLSGAGFQSAGVIRPTGMVGMDGNHSDRGRVEYSVR